MTVRNRHLRADPCTRVYVMRMDGTGLWLYFYGLTVRDLMVIPNEYLTAAVKRRGLDNGYMSSPFLVESVRPFKPSAVLRSMVDVGWS